ncbi:hypothetical protein BDR26DRAFT_860157 [Obelidium mucronatum]|nr:hypothetical protein BDR26DRAFT_860157 [Obelidium mucronatum]
MNTKPRRRARLVNGVIIVGGEGSDDEGAIDNVQDLKTVVDFYYESEAQIVEVPPPNYREGGGGGEDGNNYGSRRQSMIDYLQLPQLRNLLVGGSNSSSVILEEETAGADGGEADEHTHHSDSSTSTAAITDPLPGTAPRDLQEDMSLFSNNTQQQQQQQQQSPFPFENNESIIDVLRTRSIASTRPSMMSLDSALEFRRGSVGRFEVDVEDVMSTYEFDTDIVIEGVEAVNANVALARASMMLGGFDGHEAE